MALANTKLQKVGSLNIQGNGQDCTGHTQCQLVKGATALPDPGGYDGTASWHYRRAQWLESVQVTAKYSQDSE